MIWGLYDVAISAGVAPNTFWDLSLLELRCIIKVQTKDKLTQRKMDIMNSDLIAARIAEYISTMFDGDNTVRSIYDVYPDVFKEEKEKYEKETAEQQFALRRANQAEFVEIHNKKRRRE